MKYLALHYGRLLISSFVLLLVVITIMFLLLQAAPGDPIQTLVGDAPVPESFRRQLVETYGLDEPLYQRYVTYVGHVLTGDLGQSFVAQAPVAELIWERLGNTLLIAVPSLVISTVGGIVLGSIAARTRKRWLDTSLSGGAVAMFSVPNFWLGLMLISLFSITLGWLPAQGMNGYGQSGFSMAHLVLPVVTLASTELAFKTRIMRSSMIEALGQDFMDTARSKGLPRRDLLIRHALPNALLPMVTVVGYSLGMVLAGSVLVEKVYGWPGMGLLMIESINHQDTSVVLGVVIVITVSILIVNILTDVVYGIVDPRLRARAHRSARSAS